MNMSNQRHFGADFRHVIFTVKAMEILGSSNKLDKDSVKTALKQAYVEVESETLKNFGYRKLLIPAALVKNQDTNRGYSHVSVSGIMLGVSKSTSFRA